MPQLKSDKLKPRQVPVDLQLLATYDVADAAERASQSNEGVIESNESLENAIGQLESEISGFRIQMRELKEAIQELINTLKGE